MQSGSNSKKDTKQYLKTNTFEKISMFPFLDIYQIMIQKQL